MSTNINIKKKLAILDEGASVTTDATSIDFVGSGVNASTIDGDVTITIPGGSGNTTYYLNQTVDQAPYKEFSSIVTSAVEQVIPLTVLAGATSVIAEYQTPSNIPGTTQIPGGLWQFFLHFNAVAAGQNWIIRPRVYKRDLGGTETLIFTPDPEIVTAMSTTTTMYVCDGVFPATTLLTTDRIVVRISMQNTTGVSQTVNFRTEGSQHYSVGLTTLNQVIPTGAVTSVTGTAPIVSSGGLTPAISIAQASAIADGYLSSSDFAVFDAKVPATRSITINGTTLDLSADRTWNVGTVTSVAALTLGTTGTDLTSSVATGTTTPVITLNVPTASASNRGALSSTDWTTFNGKADGSGTINYVSKFTGTGTLGNSNIFDNGTNVGIGTITPAKLLDVNGDALINGHTVGRGGGNVATNTAVGLSAGAATSLGQNAFFGWNAGIYNGSSGTVAVGFGAGKFYGNLNLALTSAGNSIYIGNQATALLNSANNEIVIGSQAMGKGSNTVQLGNTSITNTYLQGDVEASGNFLLGANAKYLYGKNSSGVSTRMIGINGSNAFYIGSIDANVTAINFNINGTNLLNIDNTGVITTKNYTLPLAAPTAGQVLGYLGAGTTQWTTPSSSSGIWGISNASGVYTYYATWALAVAAATSGQCIELFADITENTGALILKDGVNINGNGHTLTHNFANHGFTDNGVSVQCSINNLTLNKSNSPYYALSIQNGATNINGNAVFKGTQGIVSCSGKINGFTIIGGYCLELNASTSVGSNLNVYCTTGTSVILTNGAKLNNSYINTTNGVGVVVTSGDLNNSTVYANGNVGVTLTAGNVNNCSVLSTTSNAINSAAGTVINGGSFVSTGQTIGTVLGYTSNAYFRSTVNDGIGLGGNINNCVVISDLYSPVISNSVFQMYNCEIISLTSRASNYGVTGITAGSYVVDNIFTISSISTAIHSAGTPTVYLSGNSIKGTTNFKSAGIVNGQTNTADAQGNVILQ